MTPTGKKLVVVLQDATNNETTIWFFNGANFYPSYVRHRSRGTNITCYADLKRQFKIPKDNLELLKKKDSQILV